MRHVERRHHARPGDDRWARRVSLAFTLSILLIVVVAKPAGASGRMRRRQAPTITHLVTRLIERESLGPTTEIRPPDEGDTLPHLTGAVKQRLAAELAPIRRLNSFDDRLELFLEQRSRAFEAIVAIRSSSPLPTRSAAISAALKESRMLLRNHIAESFAPEIGRAGVSAPVVMDALDYAASWRSWEHLRCHLGRDPTRTSNTLRSMIRSILLRPGDAEQL